jgi:hypothetical protein
LDRLGLLQVEVFEISAGLDADSPGLEYFASVLVPLEEEQFLPEDPVGVNPQETLVEQH